MREWLYLINESEASLSLNLRILDRRGEKRLRYCYVKGWRKELIKNFIGELATEGRWNSNNGRNWDYNAKIFVCLKALQAARNRFEGSRFAAEIGNMSIGETHFWASKFIANPKTKRAFRILHAIN